LISPDELFAKLRRLYPQAVRASFEGDSSFFPFRVRCDLSPPEAISQAVHEVALLRSQSKSETGSGYSIRWEARRSRTLGQNDFPAEIWVESMDDLVRSIGKLGAWRQLSKAKDLLLHAFPELQPWVLDKWKRLEGIEDRVGSLIQVVQYLKCHSCPDCFVRELPLPIPTKWISEHASLLAEWLDIVLPPSSIDFGTRRTDFEARYGFRRVHEHLRLRFLDAQWRETLEIGFEELSLPVSVIQDLPPTPRVLFVENKVNWLTLPGIPRCVAFGGLGRGVSQLFEVAWIESASILYWGDLDVEGFEILAMVRGRWPNTQSLFMDEAAVHEFAPIGTRGMGRRPQIPLDLMESEALAMRHCIQENLRVEQEHIPQVRLLGELARRHLIASSEVGN